MLNNDFFKNRFHLIGTILFLFLSSLSGANAAYLSGKIMDQVTEQPLPGAVVWLEGTNYYGTSDVNGEYYIDNIPDGIYTIIVGGQDHRKKIYKHFGVGIYAGYEEDNPIKPPEKFLLNQNYPNPFNPQTTISYQLPTQSYVKLDIFDSLGRHVITLIEGQQKTGYHSVKWDARNDENKKVASGIYYYRLQIGTWQQILKMIVLE